VPTALVVAFSFGSFPEEIGGKFFTSLPASGESLFVSECYAAIYTQSHNGERCSELSNSALSIPAGNRDGCPPGPEIPLDASFSVFVPLSDTCGPTGRSALLRDRLES